MILRNMLIYFGIAVVVTAGHTAWDKVEAVKTNKETEIRQKLTYAQASAKQQELMVDKVFIEIKMAKEAKEEEERVKREIAWKLKQERAEKERQLAKKREEERKTSLRLAKSKNTSDCVNLNDGKRILSAEELFFTREGRERIQNAQSYMNCLGY